MNIRRAANALRELAAALEDNSPLQWCVTLNADGRTRHVNAQAETRAEAIAQAHAIVGADAVVEVVEVALL